MLSCLFVPDIQMKKSLSNNCFIAAIIVPFGSIGILGALPAALFASYELLTGELEPTRKNFIFLAGSIVWAVLAWTLGAWLDDEEKPSKKTENYTAKTQYPANWQEIRERVLERDGRQCGNCGSKVNLHVHHIVPLSVNGTNNLGNLRTLCKDCHTSLHPHMKE